MNLRRVNLTACSNVWMLYRESVETNRFQSRVSILCFDLTIVVRIEILYVPYTDLSRIEKVYTDHELINNSTQNIRLKL